MNTNTIALEALKAACAALEARCAFGDADLCRAAIAALEAQPSGWMPIESAPKHGRILVYNPYFGVYSSEYTVERETSGPDDMRPSSELPVKWAGYPLGLTNTGFGKWFPTAMQWTTLPTPPKD